MKLDFDKLKQLQYCDNATCRYHNQIGVGNVCILSRQHNQVYCNGCKNRWVLTKDTFFYDLRTEKSVVISVLKDLTEGKAQRAIHRTTGVCTATQNRWLVKAANHVETISEYLEKQMHLTRIQIDEFWSFILKKRELHTSRGARKY